MLLVLVMVVVEEVVCWFHLGGFQILTDAASGNIQRLWPSVLLFALVLEFGSPDISISAASLAPHFVVLS